MVKRTRQPKGTGALIKDEKVYEKEIKDKILKPLFAGTVRRLEEVPKIKTAWMNAVNEEFATFNVTAESANVTETYLTGLRKAHKERMIKSFGAALGIDITPFMSDLAIRATMEKALATNIDLIVSIPRELNSQVLTQFQRVFDKKGFDQQAMLDALERRFKVAGSRAKLIARDQTGKIIGDLNKERQTGMGIKSYIWQTSEDERVVGTPGGEFPEGNFVHGNHFERNGKEFLWAVPPFDGHPGQPINCRCVNLPIIPELQEAA